MKLLLNKAHFPVTALGPGRRVGLWFQGCTIGCPGCISRDTWPRDVSFETTVAAVSEWVFDVAHDGVDGVTISGGEPFEQPEALGLLLDALIGWRERDGLDFDILAYSGLRIAGLKRRFLTILAKLDAVISEPFVAREAPGPPGIGSGNQVLTCLSERGRLAFERCDPSQRSMQIAVDDGSIWIIGVPRPGDMERIEALASARGLKWRGASWRG